MQIFKKFIIYKRFKRDKDIDDDDSIPESRVPSFVINLKEEEEKNIKMEEKDQELKGKSQLAKKAEQVFRNKFMNSSKYNSFIINFCEHHEVIDVNKIPYTFFNEFISYFEYDISINLMEIDIIGIIEQFYGKIKLLDFEEISNKRQKEPKIEKPKIKNSPKKREMKKEKQIKNRKQKQIKIEYENELKCIDTFKEDINLQNVYLFSFDNFSEYYQEYLRVIINREQEDDKENFSKVKSINRMFKKYKRNNYFLSQTILNTYITFLNNNLKELLKTFELIKCEYETTEKDEIKNTKELSSININYNLSINKNLWLDSAEIKNEKKENFYLIQNKLNKDRSLKEKLFGTYDTTEITDTIKNNLIFERFFSPYTLIKFSLLNILAITRIFKSDIINNQIIMKIICTFCDITKLQVQEYMNIYLNIFENMYQKENLREEYKIKECIKIIYLYFTKTNMIQFEKTDKLLSEIEIDIEEEYHLLNTSSILESDDFKEYIKKNGHFFQVKDGFFSSTKRNFENALKSIEAAFIGKYEKMHLILIIMN